MFLLNSDLSKITVDDLQSLCDNQVLESRDIEYKQTILIGPTAEEKKKIKLLAGISSFANTDGGDFLVGIRAVNGIPEEITPMERGKLDAIKLAIEQLVQTGISPRIAPVLHEIRLSSTHSVLLVRIARSWAAPHRVTLAGDNNFYGRHSSGMYPMDIDQLRAAFNLTGAIRDRIHQTRDRLLDVIARQESRTLCDQPWIAIHLIPFESLDPSRVFDLQSQVEHPAISNLTPLGQENGRRYLETRFNLDGVASVLPAEPQGTRLHAYTQLFRNGVIESVNTTIEMTPKRSISAYPLAGELLMAFRRFLRTQERLQVAPPVMVLISLMGVRDYELNISTGQLTMPPQFTHRFDRDYLLIPGVVVNSFKVDRGSLFKPILDVLWNAAGYERCRHYTEDGALNLKPEWFQGEVVA